jgi:hypothetical protein
MLTPPANSGNIYFTSRRAFVDAWRILVKQLRIRFLEIAVWIVFQFFGIFFIVSCCDTGVNHILVTSSKFCVFYCLVLYSSTMSAYVC